MKKVLNNIIIVILGLPVAYLGSGFILGDAAQTAEGDWSNYFWMLFRGIWFFWIITYGLSEFRDRLRDVNNEKD